MYGWKYILVYVSFFHLAFSVMCRRLYQKRRTATRKTLSATQDTTLYAIRYTEFIQNYMWHNIRHYLQHYIRHTIYSIICGTLSTALYAAHYLRLYIRHTIYSIIYSTLSTALYTAHYLRHYIRHYLQHYIRHTIYSIIYSTLSTALYTALYTAHHLQHYIQHTIYSIIYGTLSTALYTALPLVQHSLCLSILCVPHKTMDRHSIPNFLIYLQIVLLCIPRIRAASVLLPPACSIAWAKHASVISLLIFS